MDEKKRKYDICTIICCEYESQQLNWEAGTSIADVFKEFDWLLFQVTLDYGYDLDSCPKWYKELWLQNQAKNENR